MKRRNFLQSAVLGLVAVFAVVTANLGFKIWQGMVGRAVIKETAGRSSFVSAGLYGVPPETAAEMTAAAAAGGLVGENTEVQNIQPPSISGFSTDLFTGNSTINYSLDLPPGRGGLTPSVSLVYSSASVYDQVIGADFDDDGGHDSNDVTKWKENLYVQSSQAGLGWQVGGLGSIFRDALGRYTLVLNGQSYRLFQKDDSSWRTEPESFLKIHHRVIEYEEPGGEGSPADKFIIYDTNGTYYEFTPRGFFWKRCDYRDFGCKQATAYQCEYELYPGDPDWWRKCEQWAASWNRWVLNRVKDVHGNEIDIPYAEERRKVVCGGLGVPGDQRNYTYPRALYPYEINYSGTYTNLDKGFQAKIEFYPLYPEPPDQFDDNRLDDENMRRTENGCLALYYSQKRIEKINVKVRQPDGSWKIVRQYDLDNDQYFTGKDSKDLHPKLLGITARGRDDNTDGTGDQILPTQTFTYYEDGSNLHTFRLLSTADNGYGGKVQYAYQQYWTPDYNPTTGQMIGNGGGVSETHRVTEKTAFDGRGNSFKTTYGYEGPRGISDDRDHSGFESLGHSQVTETVFAKNSNSKIRETKYYFIQGKEGEGQYQGWFYVWPERGRVEKVEIKDDNGKLLSVSETDYLRETPDGSSDYNAAQSAIWETSHFIASKESRSCQDPTLDWSVGNKTTYYYRKEDQKTNGTTPEQWGNLTQTTTYKVDIDKDCNSAHIIYDVNGNPIAAESDAALAGATAYRMTHSTYFPNSETHITNRVGGTQTLACNTDLAGTAVSFVDCPTPKRLALSWNFYDNAERPWHTPGSKGELTSSRVWYEFPEVVNVSEFQNGSWRTMDAQNGYDQFGNLTTASSFSDYGRVSASSGQWTLAGLGGGSSARTSTTAYDSKYQTFPILTTNLLGHQNRTGYWRDDTEVGHPYLANKVFSWDPNNQQSTSVLDGLGRLVSSFRPGEGVASVKVDYRDADPFFVHTQTRDDKDDGGTVTYHHTWQIYNGLGQLIENQTEQEGDGQKIALTFKDYNALGQVEKELLPYDPGVAGGVGGKYIYLNPDWSQPYNEIFYDSLGRGVKSIAPGNRVTQTAYYGRKTAVLDANQHLKVSEVDPLGRLINAQEFEGERGLGVPGDPYTTTQFSYDELDRLRTTTDSLGNTATVSYNQIGQKVSSDDPDLGLWRYTYYPTGTLATTTDAKGQVKSFLYDGLDRVKFKFYGDTNTAPVAFFGYDDTCQNGIGRRCSDVTTNRPEDGFIEAGSVYNYDAKGRLISETKRIEGENFVTQFVYDAASRRREIIYPSDGEKVTYTYNDAGQLVNVTGNQTYLASAKYNILGQPEEEVLGSQAKNIYTYEPNTYRLKTKTVKGKDDSNLWKQELKYDPAGNIKDIIYPFENLTTTYSYDELNRLTGMTTSKEGFSSEYDYDVLGRMTLKTEEGAAEEIPSCPLDASPEQFKHAPTLTSVFSKLMDYWNPNGDWRDDSMHDATSFAPFILYNLGRDCENQEYVDKANTTVDWEIQLIDQVLEQIRENPNDKEEIKKRLYPAVMGHMALIDGLENYSGSKVSKEKITAYSHGSILLANLALIFADPGEIDELMPPGFTRIQAFAFTADADFQLARITQNPLWAYLGVFLTDKAIEQFWVENSYGGYFTLVPVQNLPPWAWDQGSMLMALSGAYRVSGKQEYLDKKRMTVQTVLSHLWDGERNGFFDEPDNPKKSLSDNLILLKGLIRWERLDSSFTHAGEIQDTFDFLKNDLLFDNLFYHHWDQSGRVDWYCTGCNFFALDDIYELNRPIINHFEGFNNTDYQDFRAIISNPDLMDVLESFLGRSDDFFDSQFLDEVFDYLSGERVSYKVKIENVDNNSLLLAFNLSGTDRAWITFDFYKNDGAELFFIGDWAQPMNDSIEIGERSHVPILTSILNDLPADYQGYVIVESHNRIDYPGGTDPNDHGPSIWVISGPAGAICALYPESVIPGDLNCDCKSNMIDIMKVAAIWDSHPGDGRYKQEYDFDNDGDIDIADIMHITPRWNSQCPD